MRMIEFAKKVDLYYEGMKIRKELKIGGAWKAFLMEERKIQSTIYGGNADASEIAIFHEEMFFNELVKGLWNYGYITRGKEPSQTSRSRFMSDLKTTNIIYPDNKLLVAKNKIPMWGHKSEKGLIKYTDVAHSIQVRNINDIAEYCKSQNNSELSFLEIGSGYGGLAEKLLPDCRFKKLIMFDIPHNLMTAYYYLSQSNMCRDGIHLVNSIDDINNSYADSNIKIILCPTCFYGSIQHLDGNFILGNFGSFSKWPIKLSNTI